MSDNKFDPIKNIDSYISQSDWRGKENANLLFEVTAKFGIPYFQNCLAGGINPSEIRSMCCHLMLDLKQFYKRLGGFFGYADKTGSVGVVTINLPRIGYLAKDGKDFFKRVEQLMELAQSSLERKRKVVQKNIDQGLLPYTKRYLGALKWHFSTSSWLPVKFTEDIYTALKHQEKLQPLYTGGTVFHAFLGERMGAPACKVLIEKIAENFKLPYFTITPTFSICPEHRYLAGEQFSCPKCLSKTEVYSRVVGYLRPVQNWHIGKQEEYKERVEYKEGGINGLDRD